MSTTEVVEVLVKAKSLIEDPQHWIKGNMGGTQINCYCSAGALRQARFGTTRPTKHGITTYDDDIFVEAANLVAKHVLEEDLDQTAYFFAEDEIVDFNDAVGTKHENVISVFDAAIKEAQTA